MAKTETQINELKINYLTQELYDAAVANGEINENEIYLTPNTGGGANVDLSEYATKTELNTGLSGKANSSHTHSEYAASSHGTHVSFTTTKPVMNGTAAVGSASTVSRSDHVHPSDTNKADKNHTHSEYASSTHNHNSDYLAKSNPSGTGTFSMNSNETTIALGRLCSASGENSCAIGYYTEAKGKYSFAEGEKSLVTTDSTAQIQSGSIAASQYGEAAHAEGHRTTACGAAAHAEGSQTLASGLCSHAEGDNTTASGIVSHAEGYYTTALSYQHAQGHYNDTSKATVGQSGGTTGTAFIIGNGTYTTVSNACRITYAGAVIGKAAYQSTGADYAEYFEWADKNPDNEERVGYFVTFEDGRYIRKANADEYILGIVSGNPCVLGNNDECWMGQNEMDEWNRFIYVTETGTDETTGETYEYQTYKVNPDYDSSMPYTHRADRPEWDAIGMLGVLSVRDDGTCKVNGYCKVADGGIATASDTGYRVIERVTDNIVKVVFR